MGGPGYPGAPGGSQEELFELYEVTHKWGKCILPGEIPDRVKITIIDAKRFPPLKDRLAAQEKRLKEETRNQPNLDIEGLLKLADWILQHWNYPTDQGAAGSIVMRQVLEERIAEMERQAPNDPRVKALIETREHVGTRLPENSDEIQKLATLLGGRNQEYRPTASDHYVLLHPGGLEGEAEKRLRRLEHLYAGFHYWFASRGHSLSKPVYKLIGVLTKDLEDFERVHKLLDELPLTADGFYSNFDNVAVYSLKRTDTAFKQLDRIARDLDAQGLHLQQLLKSGDKFISRPSSRSKKQQEPEHDVGEVLYAQAVALAQKAAEEEAEIATLTHVGVQQLVTACGLLPSRLRAPEWLRLGLASFFETPRSEGELNLATMSSGIGAPSWVYMGSGSLPPNGVYGIRTFFEQAGKEVGVPPYETHKIKLQPPSLRKVITDQVFVAAARAPRDDRYFLNFKARAEAWGLFYFLARKKLPQLMAYFDQLSQMPRDLPLSEEALLVAFGRAFGLTKSDQSHELDDNKVEQLEKEWKEFISFQHLEILPFQEEKSQETPAKEKQRGRPRR
ncbi:MAG: hypothetical protein C4297_05115 [Gemmataceae bacterium]